MLHSGGWGRRRSGAVPAGRRAPCALVSIPLRNALSALHNNRAACTRTHRWDSLAANRPYPCASTSLRWRAADTPACASRSIEAQPAHALETQPTRHSWGAQGQQGLHGQTSRRQVRLLSSPLALRDDSLKSTRKSPDDCRGSATRDIEKPPRELQPIGRLRYGDVGRAARQ